MQKQKYETASQYVKEPEQNAKLMSALQGHQNHFCPNRSQIEFYIQFSPRRISPGALSLTVNIPFGM